MNKLIAIAFGSFLFLAQPASAFQFDIGCVRCKAGNTECYKNGQPVLGKAEWTSICEDLLKKYRLDLASALNTCSMGGSASIQKAACDKARELKPVIAQGDDWKKKVTTAPIVSNDINKPAAAKPISADPASLVCKSNISGEEKSYNPAVYNKCPWGTTEVKAGASTAKISAGSTGATGSTGNTKTSTSDNGFHKKNANGYYVDEKGNKITDSQTIAAYRLEDAQLKAAASGNRYDQYNALKTTALEDAKNKRDAVLNSDVSEEVKDKARSDYNARVSQIKKDHKNGSGEFTVTDENGKAMSKKDLKREAKADQKKVNAQTKNNNELKDQESIRDDNGGDYGGHYGGKNVAQTQVINQGLEMLRGTLEQKSLEVNANRNAAEQVALQSKGMTATQSDAIKTQVNQIKNGVKTLGTQGLITTGIAAFQGYQGIRHLQSKAAVQSAQNSVYNKNKTEVDQGNAKLDASELALADKRKMEIELAGIPNTAENSAKRTELATKIADKETEAKKLEREGKSLLEEGNKHTSNTANNATNEMKAQNAAAYSQALTAAATMKKAMDIYKEKAAAKAAAINLEKMAQLTTGGGGFTYNPGGGNPGGNPDGNPNNNPNIDPQIVTGDQEAGIDTSGDDPINPGAGDGGVNGPAADKFIAGDPNKGAGGQAGGLGQGGGSTSAAQDSKGGEQVAPGKNQTGGQYAAGDNAGGGSRFSAGSKGPTADTSFMDMMKNLLNGEDKGNHQGVQDIADRSIASDQPSVLGRNKNLFEEISKSYQKKSNEGAIVFSGDRS